MRAKVEALVRVALLLCAVQLVRFGLETAAYLLVGHTWLTDGLVRIAVFTVLLGALIWHARRGGWGGADGSAASGIPVPPPTAKKTRFMRTAYFVGLAVLAVLFVATPFVTGQAGDLAVWISLACTALATPIFEEWLFRGYVWRRLRPAFGSGWQLVVVTAVLFGLWHLGYADAVAWQIAQPEALGSAPLWAHLGVKVGFAAAMGAVLGAVRLKSGGWMAPALLHALWNLLA